MSDLLNGISIFHQLQSFEYSGLHPIGFFQDPLLDFLDERRPSFCPEAMKRKTKQSFVSALM